MTHSLYMGATMHYIDDGIDTGRIIAQERVALTEDIDQGLVYKISFDLEGPVFRKGMKLLQAANFRYEGKEQVGEGSYFNRTDELQTITPDDTSRLAIDKIKSFGIKGQGTLIKVEGVQYKVYAAEQIVNPYLLKIAADTKAGQIVFKYDTKVVVKTSDGAIKLTDYEIVEQ